jgi:NADH-quinone oxidoreductase subunit G
MCTRCVRFCDEIAGVPELMVQERGDHSMVATFPGKKMTNPYAGCTVDVCPVGALTSKDFRYKKRVWFLQQAESVCPGCSRGCNIELHHADNKLFRLKPRYNKDINEWWMCDEGRSGYKFVNEGRRLRPGIYENGSFVEMNVEESLVYLRREIAAFKSSELVFIASAQESNESIDAFIALAQETYGALQVYYSKNEPASPFSDDFLMTADKNPNSAHIKKRGLRPAVEIPLAAKAAVIQRDLSMADAALVRSRGIFVLALFATNLTLIDNLAKVILPILTFAEQDGHFTNLEGRVQSFKQALQNHGEAKPMQFYVEALKE